MKNGISTLCIQRFFMQTMQFPVLMKNENGQICDFLYTNLTVMSEKLVFDLYKPGRVLFVRSESQTLRTWLNSR